MADGSVLPQHATPADRLSRVLVPPTCPADLESLFIDSDKVRRELPEATERFARIDGELAWRCLQPHSAWLRLC